MIYSINSAVQLQFTYTVQYHSNTTFHKEISNFVVELTKIKTVAYSVLFLLCMQVQLPLR
jgi:hypothetical protein